MRSFVLLCAISFVFQQISYSFEIDSVRGSKASCGASGRVIAPPYLVENGLDVELVGETTAIHQKVHLAGTNFDFTPVPEGEYQLHVLDASGNAILKSTRQLKGEGDYLLLRFPPSTWQQSSDNMISLRQLGHQVPSKAIKAVRDGEKAAESGDLAKSVQLFEKATALDPQFAGAELQLAMSYYRIGQHGVGLEHAQAAYDLDPESVDSGQALAMMLIYAQRYRDAEGVLRCLLRTHSGMAELEGILAASIIGKGGNIDEAFQHLKIAARDFPLARLLVADVLVATGYDWLAVGQVKAFIESSNSECESQQFENWIKKVTLKAPLAQEQATGVSGGAK